MQRTAWHLAGILLASSDVVMASMVMPASASKNRQCARVRSLSMQVRPPAPEDYGGGAMKNSTFATTNISELIEKKHEFRNWFLN